MSLALEAAQAAGLRNEVPVGAVVISPTKDILAISGNEVEVRKDISAHAEMRALKLAAQKMQQPRLVGCTLYVTLEPCAMCAAAISFYRIKCLVFGAYDPKGGAVDHGARFFQLPTCFHSPEIIGGVRERECSHLLHTFFKHLRDKKR